MIYVAHKTDKQRKTHQVLLITICLSHQTEIHIKIHNRTFPSVGSLQRVCRFNRAWVQDVMSKMGLICANGMFKSARVMNNL